MAYSIELDGKKIFLSMKAETESGTYVVYEWNDGVFFSDDYDDDECLDCEDQDCENCDILDDDDIFFDENEDDDEKEIREEIETLIAHGFVPQGGVATLITPEYTTCYSQAFFKKK